MIFVLDTDVFTLLTRPTVREQHPSLVEHITQNQDAMYITAITAEEVLRGALAVIRSSISPKFLESTFSNSEVYQSLATY